MLEMNYTEQQLTAAVVSGLRPVLAGPESGAPANLLFLIQRCWDADPQNRPSFSDIVFELDAILESGERDNVRGDTFVDSVISNGPENITDIRGYQEPKNWFTYGQDVSKGTNSYANLVPSWLSSEDTPVYHPVLCCGSFSTCGRRETMEDTYFMMPHFCNEDVHFFGIFDGHRGM